MYSTHCDGSYVAQNAMVRDPQLDSRALKYNPTAWLSGYAGTGENWGNNPCPRGAAPPELTKTPFPGGHGH